MRFICCSSLRPEAGPVGQISAGQEGEEISPKGHGHFGVITDLTEVKGHSGDFISGRVGYCLIFKTDVDWLRGRLGTHVASPGVPALVVVVVVVVVAEVVAVVVAAAAAVVVVVVVIGVVTVVLIVVVAVVVVVVAVVAVVVVTVLVV
ncbi:hypothetical protein ElyMa_000692000 [Elysia marginata]|uniref:Uncharacterized protein n=1 Tax=Elysia marginata TaxID=1093978 RepID=A0AAV4GID8_9GAST|nr:hypothetical protein ElyMa_000692000 [Elysia marginata]